MTKSRNTQKSTGRGKGRTSMVAYRGADGIRASSRMGDIPRGTKHHGTTMAGVEVHSPSTITLGDKVILTEGSGRRHDIVANDYEIAAVGHLQGLGYIVTKPTDA